jgi:serine/threonine-protein kinase
MAETSIGTFSRSAFSGTAGPLPDLELGVEMCVPFDEYTLIARLAQGGMAEVFLALSQGARGFRRLVVIKRLYEHLARDPNLVRMFLDEARICSRLNHPNVVRTEKFGEADGRYFLAMEYLEGQALNAVLARCQSRAVPLRPELAARIVSDALDGLAYAHEARDYDGSPLGIIHRDVSPHNLFVGYDGTVKLLDFGIARCASREADTVSGFVKGKFGYMAPEQALSSHIDARVDIWSMGVVFWELLTGARLFKGQTDAATLHRVLHEEVQPPSLAAAGVPEGLERIVLRALARPADARYPSARAMKDELDDWLDGARTPRAALSRQMHLLFEDRMSATRGLIQRATQSADELHPASARTSASFAPLSNTIIEPSPLRKPRRARAWLPLAALSLIAVVGAAALLRARTVVWSAEHDGSPRAVLAAPVTPTAAAVLRAPAPSASANVIAVADGLRVGLAPALKRSFSAAAGTMQSGESGPAPQVAPAPVGSGSLRFDTSPWSIVSLGGRVLGQTPLIDVQLPEGTHVLRLENPELGISTTYSVVVRPGERTVARVGLE